MIASRLTGHARELSGALCRLQATSQAPGASRSRWPMAEEALAEMIRDGSRVVRLADIEKAVCDASAWMRPACNRAASRSR